MYCAVFQYPGLYFPATLQLKCSVIIFEIIALCTLRNDGKKTKWFRSWMTKRPWNAIRDLLASPVIPSIIKSHARSPNDRDGSVNRPATTLYIVAEEIGSNKENWNFVSISASFRDEFPCRADPPQVVYLSADRRPFGQTGTCIFNFALFTMHTVQRHNY